MENLSALFHGFNVALTWYNGWMMLIGLVLGIVIALLVGWLAERFLPGTEAKD